MTRPTFAIGRIDMPHGGMLALSRCPGRRLPGEAEAARGARLEAEIHMLRSAGASVVITLLEAHEFERLGVPSLLGAYARQGLMAWHCPIPDMHTPGADFAAAWVGTGPQLAASLRGDACVAVHCAAGLGRTGMFAARLLVLSGLTPETAVARVRQVRPGAIETRAQEAFVGAADSFDWHV